MRQIFRLIRLLVNIERILSEVLGHMERVQAPKNEVQIWLDSYEVMDTYKVSRSTLYRWKIQSILVPSKIGKRDMYVKAEIEEVLRQYRKGDAEPLINPDFS